MWRLSTLLGAVIAALAVLAAHLLLPPPIQAIGAGEATPAEAALFDLARRHGSLIRLRVGRACSACLRGTVATEDVPEGEEVLALPLAPLAVPLPPSGYAAEYARVLLPRLKQDPTFAAAHGPYWATMPGPNGVFCSELFTDGLLAALHTPALETLIRGQRDAAVAIFEGTWEHEPYPPFNDTLGSAAAVSLPEFLHVAALIGTRDFGLSKEAAAAGGPAFVATVEASGVGISSWLIPIADLINHGPRPNAIRSDNGTHILFHALEDISAGEEITADYQWHVLHRNDMALAIYGFTMPENEGRLLAVDLPDYSPEDPYRQTPESDGEYYGPEGSHNTAEEAARLRALLAEAEALATAEEDEAALAGGLAGGWKEETVVRMRLGRRRALRAAAEAVEAQLTAAAAAEA